MAREPKYLAPDEKTIYLFRPCHTLGPAPVGLSFGRVQTCSRGKGIAPEPWKRMQPGSFLDLSHPALGSTTCSPSLPRVFVPSAPRCGLAGSVLGTGCGLYRRRDPGGQHCSCGCAWACPRRGDWVVAALLALYPSPPGAKAEVVHHNRDGLAPGHSPLESSLKVGAEVSSEPPVI